MDTRTPDMQAVVERLERVERQNRVLERQNQRLKLAGIAALLLVGAVMLAGAAAPTRKAIEVEKLVLTDEEGQTRAVLGAFSDDKFGLEVIDAKGVSRVRLGVGKDGTAALGFSDNAEKVRAAIGVLEGGVGLSMFDEHEQLRASLGSDKSGTGFGFFDENGDVRAGLAVNDSGSGLTIADKNGKGRVSLDVLKGTARLALADSDGKVRAELATTIDGVPTLRFLDSNKKALVGLKIGKDGRPLLRIIDEKAGVIWQAPPPDDAPEDAEVEEE